MTPMARDVCEGNRHAFAWGAVDGVTVATCVGHAGPRHYAVKR